MVDIQYGEKGIVVNNVFVPWGDIDAGRNKIRFANSVLVKIGFRYGRVSEIEDCQIYDKEEWAKIYNALSGHSAWFSDFAGKHSEVTLDFWDTVSLEEITDLDQIVDFFNRQGYYAHDLGIVSGALEQNIENGHIDEDYNRLDDEESDDED